MGWWRWSLLPYLWGYLAWPECLWAAHNAHPTKRARHLAVGQAVCRAQAEISCGDALLLGSLHWQAEGGWKRQRLLVTTSSPCSRAPVNLGILNTTPLIFQTILFQAASPSKILLEWVPWPSHQGKIWRFFAKCSLPKGSSCEVWSLTWFWMVFFEVMWHHCRQWADWAQWTNPPAGPDVQKRPSALLSGVAITWKEILAQGELCASSFAWRAFPIFTHRKGCTERNTSH